MNANRLMKKGLHPLFDYGALALLVIVMCYWSWNRWADVIIDYGHQLYYPWQITQGSVLYRDCAYIQGPLSQYINAFWMRLFGASIHALVAGNLIFLSIFLLLLKRILGLVYNRFVALVGCAVVILMFSFAQYIRINNYNFIAPYSHEATHGLLFFLASVAFLGHYLKKRKTAAAVLSGCCYGALLLTRSDIILAATASLATGLILLWVYSRNTYNILGLFIKFITGAFLPTLLFTAYFACHLPVAAAAEAAATAWLLPLSSDITRDPWFAEIIGTDQLVHNLSLMVRYFLFTVSSLLLLSAADWKLQSSKTNYRWATGFISLLAFAGLAWWHRAMPWWDLPRALPLLLVFIVSHQLIRWGKDADPDSRSLPSLSAILLSVFALFLMIKILFRVGLYHIGFYLALPATITTIAYFLGTHPRTLRKKANGGMLFTIVFSLAIGAMAVVHVSRSVQFYALNTYPVSMKGNTLRTYAPPQAVLGPVVQQSLLVLDDLVPPGEPFLVLPEGVMLNFLLQRPSPTRYIQFTPTEFILYGEQRMLSAIKNADFTYAVFVNRDVREFNYAHFGQAPAYGKKLRNWIETHFETVSIIGTKPFTSYQFGIEVLKRKETAE